MNAIELTSKPMDNLFLEGETVSCDAVIPVPDLNKGVLNEGQKIVVLLSNRKKYMAKISSFSYEIVEGYAQGKLYLKRAIG